MKHLSVQTPLGPIHLLAKNERLIVCCFESSRPRFAELFAEATDKRTPILLQARRELLEYFSGRRQFFEVPIGNADYRIPLGTTFENRVWAVLRKIEFGRTISYKEQALWMGHPRAVHAIGRANHKNPLCIFIPCHRVIGSGGAITGYTGGQKLKRWLIEHEQRILTISPKSVPKRDTNPKALMN
jgi:methylated-DNA-[protein]-cysteine S-methyltransferase